MEQRKQCGFALPVTVFALVVVGVITTGGFFMAHQEGRIGVASEHAGLAFYLTERAWWTPWVNGTPPSRRFPSGVTRLLPGTTRAWVKSRPASPE